MTLAAFLVRSTCHKSSRKPPGVHSQGADAGFDFEESDGFVKNFWGEVDCGHDFFAGAGTIMDSLEDFGLDVGVAEEVGLAEFLMMFDEIFREKFAEDVAWFCVGVGALAN